MLGLVMTLVAATAPALPAADLAEACGERAGSCEVAPLAATAPQHEEHATPAVIDCPSPVVVERSPAPSPFWVFGECEGPHDASYRTSRFPEGEDSQSLSPASRDLRGGVKSSCDGLPGKAPALPLSDAQPLALYATPVVVHTATTARVASEDSPRPSRLRDPPDRPPRV
jgi:hypothetical protein